MFRRDYIIKMVEDFVRMLTKIREERTEGQFAEANEGLDDAFSKLMGANADEICELSDTELLARLTQGGPTQSVPDKIRLLVALLQEAGLLHAAENRVDQANLCWCKALNLLLNLQMEDDFELQQFIPTVDLLREQLRDAPLPLTTLAALWRHYERIGAYAHAEDALFSLLEAQPDNPELLAEAKAFYERLLRQSDSALLSGNLPREEVSAGLNELMARKSG